MEGQVNGSTQRLASSRRSDSACRVARNGGWRGQKRKKGGFPSHPLHSPTLFAVVSCSPFLELSPLTERLGQAAQISTGGCCGPIGRINGSIARVVHQLYPWIYDIRSSIQYVFWKSLFYKNRQFQFLVTKKWFSHHALWEHAKTWTLSTTFFKSNCCFTFLCHKLWPYDCYRVSLFIFTDIFHHTWLGQPKYLKLKGSFSIHLHTILTWGHVIIPLRTSILPCLS